MAENEDTEQPSGEEGAPQTDGTGNGEGVDLNELHGAVAGAEGEEDEPRTAQDLEPVYDVPVRVQAVLGKTALEVNQLLKLGPGAVLELDRKVGEAIDIYVNNRLVARGEVVLVDDHLGVTMTEIIKSERS